MGFPHAAGGGAGRGRGGARQGQLYAHAAGLRLWPHGPCRALDAPEEIIRQFAAKESEFQRGAEPLHLPPRRPRADPRRRQQGGRRVVRSGRRDLRPHRQAHRESGLRAGEQLAACADVALRSSGHPARLLLRAHHRRNHPVRREVCGPAKGGRNRLLRLRRGAQGHRKEARAISPVASGSTRQTCRLW